MGRVREYVEFGILHSVYIEYKSRVKDVVRTTAPGPNCFIASIWMKQVGPTIRPQEVGSSFARFDQLPFPVSFLLQHPNASNKIRPLRCSKISSFFLLRSIKEPMRELQYGWKSAMVWTRNVHRMRTLRLQETPPIASSGLCLDQCNSWSDSLGERKQQTTWVSNPRQSYNRYNVSTCKYESGSLLYC